MSVIMKSMLDKSKFADTQLSPTRVLRKHFSSNITSANMLDKVMRSCSVNPPRQNADTRLLGTRNNFEDIDEALQSESKGTSKQHFNQDKEQSNTSLERDILDISEIVNVNKLTKKKILENISFDTTQHDIYNPDFSTSEIDHHDAVIEEEIKIPETKYNSVSPKKFLQDYELNLNDVRQKKISPFRIRRKIKVKSKLESEFTTPKHMIVSRNLSQNTCEKDTSVVKLKRKQNNSKVFLDSKKKKKLKVSQKSKKPYTYLTKKNTVESSHINPEPKARVSNFDHYYAKNDVILNTDKMILASSSKRGLVTIDPPVYDFSTLESGRLKSSYTGHDTQMRSAASILTTDGTKQNTYSKSRYLPTTPIDAGDQTRSS